MAGGFNIIDNSALTIAEKNAACAAGLEACGQQAEANAKTIITAKVPRNADSWYTPTGSLRNDVSHAANENEMAVGSNNSHAIYNEMGTGKFAESGGSPPWWYKGSDGRWHYTEGMTALHFIRDSLAEHTDEYEGILEKYLKG